MFAQRIMTNEEACRDCQACTLACSLYHEGACGLASARLVVSKDMALYRFAIAVCRNCPDPACLADCPNGAIRLDERGIVVIYDDECLRCGACLESCPYGAVFYDAGTDRYLKCDWCAARDEGPLCVQICPVGALAIGPVSSGEA